MERRTDDLIELTDRANAKDLEKALGKKDTAFAALRGEDYVFEATLPVKHIIETGKIEELPSGTKYRVGANGCWHKLEE